MSVLSNLCRFCSLEVDRNQSEDIFANGRLLKVATSCIPFPMSADDQYPNLACTHCIWKINVVKQFQTMVLSSIKTFDGLIAKESSQTSETVQDQSLESDEVEMSAPTERTDEDMPVDSAAILQVEEQPVQHGSILRALLTYMDNDHCYAAMHPYYNGVKTEPIETGQNQLLPIQEQVELTVTKNPSGVKQYQRGKRQKRRYRD